MQINLGEFLATDATAGIGSRGFDSVCQQDECFPRRTNRALICARVVAEHERARPEESAALCACPLDSVERSGFQISSILFRETVGPSWIRCHQDATGRRRADQVVATSLANVCLTCCAINATTFERCARGDRMRRTGGNGDSIEAGPCQPSRSCLGRSMGIET